MNRLWFLVLSLLASAVASARTYTVEDMLKVEEYGQVQLAPRAGLLLFERMRRYDSASDYSLLYFVRRQLTSILATPLARTEVARPLFEQDPAAGYWMAGLSPAGTRLAVYRIAAGVLSLGVVDLRSRSVRWLPQVPDMPVQSARPTWVGEGHLVFIAMTKPRLPLFMSLGKADREDREVLWRDQAGGTMPSVVAASSANGPEVDRSLRRLLIVDVAEGLGRTLAEGDLVDASATADGSAFAVLYAGGPVPPPAERMDIVFSSRRHSVELVTIGGPVERPTCGDVLPGTLAWNRSGSRLLAVVRDGGSDWRKARYVQIDRRGRCHANSASAPISLEGSAQRLGRGWMGDVPMVLVRGADGATRWSAGDGRGRHSPTAAPGARIVGSTRNALLMLDGGRLVRVDASGVKTVARSVTAVGPTARDVFTTGIRPMGTPGRIDFAVVERAGSRRLVALDRNGSPAAIEPLDRGETILAAEAGFRVRVARDLAGVETLHLSSASGGGRPVDRINVHFEDLDAIEARMLIAKRADGIGVAGWLYLPKGTAPHPLVVIPYPGLTFGDEMPLIDAPDEVGFMDNARFLLAAGFAVLRPGMPTDPDPRSRPKSILSQVDAAVDAALATGLVDPARLGLLGHSFGGYGVITVATLSTRYRAVVAADAPYDLAFEHGSMAGADSLRMEAGIPFAHPAWTEGGQGAMGGPADPLRFGSWVTASPRRWFKDVHVPILLVHGELDPVGIDQAEGAFIDLARLRNDVTLLRYYGEGHALYSPANLKDYYRRVVAFFDERIGSRSGDISLHKSLHDEPSVRGRLGISGDQRHARSHASQLVSTATIR